VRGEIVLREGNFVASRFFETASRKKSREKVEFHSR
jgi:hypothetical protein